MTNYVFPPDLEKTPIRFMINTRSYRPIKNAIKNVTEGVFRADPLINRNYYVLPLPQQGIDEVFNMSYETERMGAVGGAMETIKNTINQAGAGQYGAALTEALKGAAEGLAMKGLEAFSTTLGGVFGATQRQSLGVQEQLLGIIENPNLALLFKGIRLRNHNFSWKFIPRNKTESVQIGNLIRQLKSDALPSASQSAVVDVLNEQANLNIPPSRNGQSAFVLGYPHVAFIKIVGPRDDLITFNRHGCVISDIRVSYSQGEVAFYKDSFHPAEVTLSIQLQERSIVTREDHNSRLKGSDGTLPLSDLIYSNTGIEEGFSTRRATGGRF
jgi:hypothetical protein